MTAPVIECRGVSVRRHRAVVLDDVSFTIPAGERVVVAGANGAGKTTLLHTILGFLAPTAGRVTIHGQRPGARSTGSGRCVGYVPQQAVSAAALPVRVRDFVAIGRCGYTGPGRRLTAADHDAIAAAMTAVHIDHLADRPLDAVSGGELQRAQLARVLAQDTGLLLLDEPAAGLDLGARAALFDVIGSLCTTRGLTVLLVMHELACLPAACRRALVLDRGRLAWDGDADALFTPDLLSLVYGAHAGRVAATLRGGRSC